MTEAADVASRDRMGRDSLGRAAGPLLFPLRLIIAVIQGAALWWLSRSASAIGQLCDNDPALCPRVVWPGTVPELFAPLVLVFLFIPVLLLAGIGRMRPRTLAIWAIAATTALALLGWHDVARLSADTLRSPPFSGPLFFFSAAALFISHHLILPADNERRWIASFPAYFDTAWKAGVQLALSIGFTGAFWLLLHLGAALFNVIGLSFLSELLRQDWFNIPVTCLVFAIAVHLTDVRDGLIRGVRTVVLMLLSWLLLVMTVLVAGFLIALPFTGVSGLWNTGNGTSLVLAAAAALIILINTAYQDGRPDNLPPRVLRVAVRIAAVLITPLIILAFWGLALRIGQHGLTPDRIIALACALVGLSYAIGYGVAALRPFWRRGSAWMAPLERANVWTAVLSVGLILALFSPLADPTRLSVADQIARLERGAVSPEKFDYRFLRFESGKAGLAGLKRLSASPNAEVARRARETAAARNRWEDVATGAPERTPVFEVWPAGAALPDGFVSSIGTDDGRYQCRSDQCVARAIELNSGGAPEVLVATRHSINLWVREGDGSWTDAGEYRIDRCGGASDSIDQRDLLRSEDVRSVPQDWPMLTFGNGGRAEFIPNSSCDRREHPSG
jgi:hypothetical protein